MRKIEKLIIHCSASTYKDQDAAWIDKIHREERGFSSIGYHYFIKYDGIVETGRPEWQAGAHCQGRNSTSIGVCLAGLREYTEAQMVSLRSLLIELKRKYPDATLHGHCEFSNKECPAFDVTEIKKFYLEN